MSWALCYWKILLTRFCHDPLSHHLWRCSYVISYFISPQQELPGRYYENNRFTGKSLAALHPYKSIDFNGVGKVLLCLRLDCMPFSFLFCHRIEWAEYHSVSAVFSGIVSYICTYWMEEIISFRLKTIAIKGHKVIQKVVCLLIAWICSWQHTPSNACFFF